MSSEFIPRDTKNNNCDDPVTGDKHPNFDYLHRTTTGDDNYPEDACGRYLQVNAKFDNLRITNDVTVGETVKCPRFEGKLYGTAISAKGLSPFAFDIPDLAKKGKRIRHLCAEGPEAGIYIRGTLKDSNVIEIPDYWQWLVDLESITVTLTQIGYSQDLIVDKIEWGKNIIIRSGLGANIHCFYEVWAARWLDPHDHTEKLHVVYDGETPDDYPGESKNFLVGGWDYDRRDPKTGERIDTGT